MIPGCYSKAQGRTCVKRTIVKTPLAVKSPLQDPSGARQQEHDTGA
eukprot:CAMPEP_0180781298 /NCGR_PEP_ID=MMETSP1038_2-20121128/47566_1 /TAXON_ID=632150 /ORGANISM="Azadinium spinosum, Strain 3D9" /LENGTH=45 /DNA_ID= /DNA_START= /DNA_END= /DNA_ORIENTATION=